MVTTIRTIPRWIGSYVEGATIAAVVKYHGPTDKRCARWIATLIRGREEIYRATVSYSDGPIVAAECAAAKFGANWTVVSVHHIDSDTYCVGFAAA